MQNCDGQHTNNQEFKVVGNFVFVDGEAFYQISNYDRLQPFFIALNSAYEHWCYLSTTGGLTAGRTSADTALFPYETVDKIHDSHAHTGPRTIFRVAAGDGEPEKTHLWEPFTQQASDHYRLQRNLYKNLLGSGVIFEEINHDLQLTFRYRWSTSEEFGFIKNTTLINHSPTSVCIHLLDGFQNLIATGVSAPLQQSYSCLTDAYKRAELDASTQMGLFALTALIVDRAEPSEALRCTMVWCCGLDLSNVLLSRRQVAAFRNGEPLETETEVKGQKLAYLITSNFTLDLGESREWDIVADVNCGHVKVHKMRQILLSAGAAAIKKRLSESILLCSSDLEKNLALADGLQLTENRMATAHHLSNTLFNNMRGGVFYSHYRISKGDFIDFLHARNRKLAQSEPCENLEPEIPFKELADRVHGNPDLERLLLEYLPLTFSRRHGDPSRPWNKFSIHINDADGRRLINYEGNWRDIFQNWEALSYSFPEFIESILAKGLNASTIDGFNPYRITKDGIDWEVPEPDNPWSNIGYWGDHQIIYLLKFLEASQKFHPGLLAQWLEREIFTYANVPYRIKPYQNILEDHQDTIVFDRELNRQIAERVCELGTDGKLVFDQSGAIYYVNLTEKLLVPALSKLSNLVLEGGIWMNTQRPEWNDANNALVGNGVSMVTLYYLRRYIAYCLELLNHSQDHSPTLSTEVLQWFEQLQKIYQDNKPLLASRVINAKDRKTFLDKIGTAFSDYRRQVYERGFSGKSPLPMRQITAFFELALEYIDHTIQANRRENGLYHAYNLVLVSSESQGASIEHLYEMLEGQVSVLSAGHIEAHEALQILKSLKNSSMYREDQRSYMLYPNRELPGFLKKNCIPESRVKSCKLFTDLLEEGDSSIIVQDIFGGYHFNSNFRNAGSLKAALQTLKKREQWTKLVEQNQQTALDIFEELFDHKAFTGRSGTMYGYEGLGCIYWHMVAKLLLAVQENFEKAVRQGAPHETVKALAEAYYDVRGGISFNKTPSEYGAFPMDPYAHTPGFAGAQQPGMTGMVKEEILTRLGELGVQISHGQIEFKPRLLKPNEFLSKPQVFDYYAINGKKLSIDLKPGQLAFTFCQVPVIYELGDFEQSILSLALRGNNRQKNQEDTCIEAAVSAEIFHRTGHVERVDISVSKKELLFAEETS